VRAAVDRAAERVRDGVVQAVAELAGRVSIGAWGDQPEPFIGPVISDRAAASAVRSVEGLVALGATPIKPIEGVAGRGPAFLAPGLMDVTGIAAPDEEIFAPVLQVIRVADFAGAIAAANQTRFGLSAGLLSDDDALWQRFVLESRAGVINRNRPTTGASGAMPFGGLGESGNHRPSGYYAADYCAYPVASFEAPTAAGGAALLPPRLRA
jgi:succinylglutamic semialdehyde dehydrogenase